MLHLSAEHPAQRGGFCAGRVYFYSKLHCKNQGKTISEVTCTLAGGVASRSHAQETALPVSASPCSTSESKDKHHHKQRLTFLLDSFPPPPKKPYGALCIGRVAMESLPARLPAQQAALSFKIPVQKSQKTQETCAAQLALPM